MFRYIVKEYKPFVEIKNFYILEDNKENSKSLLYCSNKYSYSLKIKPNGYIPKSGLIFCDIIEKNVANKKILDIGTGQLGFLAIHSLVSGAESVEAIDIDEECIEWLNWLVKENELKNIIVNRSDLFEFIPTNKKYDIILTNPPQMPTNDGKKHDEGGVDGRKYILEILKKSRNHLAKNGELYLLVFDFLGTDKRTNNAESIFEIAKGVGYRSVEIVKKVKKTIKTESVTAKNLEHIKKIYPKYKFNVEDNNVYCFMEILRIK